MVKIRLRRTGKKRQASYRIVVADSRSPRDGRFIENIGHYNPLTDPETVRIEKARALYWLGNGAQPTEAVERLLKSQGIYEALPRLRGGESPEAIFESAAVSAPATAPAAKVEAPGEETPVAPETPAAVNAAGSEDESVEEPVAEETEA